MAAAGDVLGATEIQVNGFNLVLNKPRCLQNQVGIVAAKLHRDQTYNSMHTVSWKERGREGETAGGGGRGGGR